MQFEWLIVVIKCSLIVYGLLTKSENIGKKTNQSRVLNSFLFVGYMLRQEQQLKIEIRHIAIEVS